MFWSFAKKYWHISREIPLMYNGELSHMENSRRWSVLNFTFISLLVMINIATGYFRYYYILCRVASWEDKGSIDCARG